MEAKYVTADDKLEYSGFFGHHIRAIANSRAPVPLYHYTAGATLIQMLQSGQMWSTHVSCLNDAKELIYAGEAFRDALQAHRPKVSAEFRPCFEAFENAARVIRNTDSPAFVTCFSAKRDDLSQWRAYGGQSGYCLELDIFKLAETVHDAGDVLIPVLYGNDADTIIHDAIVWGEKFYLKGIAAARAPSPAEWAADFCQHWLWNLAFYAPMIKHDAFRDEAEWRIIHFLRPEDTDKLTFLQRSAMITRHFPITMGAKPAPALPPSLPLSKIMVGPSNHPEECRFAVGDLLVKCGYGRTVPVENSRIPYRPYL